MIVFLFVPAVSTEREKTFKSSNKRIKTLKIFNCRSFLIRRISVCAPSHRSLRPLSSVPHFYPSGVGT